MANLRLMVVDADDFEAMLTGAALSELGHHVDKFANAEIALEALSAARGTYDAVVAHSTLDTMTGLQFAREAQRNDSTLRLLLTDPRASDEIGARKGVLVLRKADFRADPAAAMERLSPARERLLPVAA